MNSYKKLTLLAFFSLIVLSVCFLLVRPDSIRVAPGLLVEHAIGKDDYVMLEEVTRKKVVDDVQGWVITPRYSLGSAGSGGYFAYDRSCKISRHFSSIKEFTIWLRVTSEIYEYSNEEGPADVFLDKQKPRFQGVAIAGACRAGKDG